MKTLLVLFANPRKTDKLNFRNEIRIMRESLERVPEQNIHLVDIEGVKKEDLQYSMERYSPSVVQFSVHSTEDSEMVLEDEKRNITIVEPESLADIFANQNGKVECVLLNCCYSEKQAAMIARHVPFVIGMRNVVNDSHAPYFSSRFISALSQGVSVQRAFNIAKAEIGLIDATNTKTPRLITARELDPAAYFLFPKPKVYAEFITNSKGAPKTYRLDEYLMYELKVYIIDAPEHTRAVLYQYMDPEWTPQEQVEEIHDTVPNYEDALDESGNIQIRITFWTTKGGVCTTTTLRDALHLRYGTDTPPAIKKAMEVFR